MPRFAKLISLMSFILLSQCGACCTPRPGYARAATMRGCEQLPSQLTACPKQTRCVSRSRYGGSESFCIDEQRNKVRHGRYARWNSRSKLVESGFFAKGQREGRWRSYRISGSSPAEVERESHYKKGRLHGRQAFFRGGMLRREAHYAGGQLHGSYREFRDSGIPNRAFYYQHGRLHGPWMETQGLIRIRGRYERGLKNGRFTVDTLAGKLLGSFVMRQGDGTWRSYHADGTPREVYETRLGTRHGSYLRYHANGKLADKGSYWKGRHDGVWQRFDHLQRLVETRSYENGSLKKTERVHPRQRRAVSYIGRAKPLFTSSALR